MELTGEYTRGQMVVEKRVDASKDVHANLEIIRTLETTEVQRILYSAFDPANK